MRVDAIAAALPPADAGLRRILRALVAFDAVNREA